MAVDKRYLRENDIWMRFQAGDRNAFASLYEAHFTALYNYGYRFCLDKALTKDAIHQLFVKLWDSREKLQSPPSVRFYLIKALRNILIDAIKKREAISLIEEHGTYQVERSREFTLIQQDQTEEQHRHLKKALDSLTKRQKEAVYLKFFENLSYEEVSSAMNLTISAVYNLISKALETLRSSTPYISLMLMLTLINISLICC